MQSRTKKFVTCDVVISFPQLSVAWQPYIPPRSKGSTLSAVVNSDVLIIKQTSPPMANSKWNSYTQQHSLTDEYRDVMSHTGISPEH